MPKDKDLQVSTAHNNNVPVWFSKRWILAYAAFAGISLRDAARMNLSVAIVCMVRHGNDSATASSSSSIANYSLQNDSNHDLPSPTGWASSSEDNLYEGEFDWDKSVQSIVLSSIFYGYTITQMPGGWLASRFGGKIVFGAASIVGTIVTLLSPVAARWDYRALVVLRIILGLAQGITAPTVHAMLGPWAPKAERTKLITCVFNGSNAGTLGTLVLGGYLCAYDTTNGWALLFYLQGIASAIWVALWFYLVYDTPDSHPTISKAERDYIINSIGRLESKALKVPWKAIFKSRNQWVCIVAVTTNNFMGFIMVTSLPTFMKEVFKFEINENGLLSAIPFVAMAVSTGVIGQMADFLRAHWLSTTATRRLIQCLSFIGSGGCLVGAGFVSHEHRVLGVAVITVAMIFQSGCYSGFVVNCMDFAPRYAGILFGITNSFGSISGFMGPIIVGLLTQNKSQEEWRHVFYVCAGLALVGAIVFTLFARAELEPWAVDQQELVVLPSNPNGTVENGVKPTKEMHETHDNPGFDLSDETVDQQELVVLPSNPNGTVENGVKPTKEMHETHDNPGFDLLDETVDQQELVVLPSNPNGTVENGVKPTKVMHETHDNPGFDLSDETVDQQELVVLPSNPNGTTENGVKPTNEMHETHDNPGFDLLDETVDQQELVVLPSNPNGTVENGVKPTKEMHETHDNPGFDLSDETVDQQELVVLPSNPHGTTENGVKPTNEMYETHGNLGFDLSDEMVARNISMENGFIHNTRL